MKLYVRMCGWRFSASKLLLWFEIPNRPHSLFMLLSLFIGSKLWGWRSESCQTIIVRTLSQTFNGDHVDFVWLIQGKIFPHSWRGVLTAESNWTFWITVPIYYVWFKVSLVFPQSQSSVIIKGNYWFQALNQRLGARGIFSRFHMAVFQLLVRTMSNVWILDAEFWMDASFHLWTGLK